MVLEAGFWAGMTLYPETKCTAARAVDMIERYGPDRLWMNSACDWGVSVPLAVPYAALELRKRGRSAEEIDRIVYQNPRRFLSQCQRFTGV
jgi:predicted metal-dependent TIM-barrel fold hydrolase